MIKYREALAHYQVAINEGGLHEAQLQKYCGIAANKPPQRLQWQEDEPVVEEGEAAGLIEDLKETVKTVVPVS